MRVCLVYDCLFPHTVGGAERWYRHLAERLAADGHTVTYLTLRQWDRGEDPGVAGVEVRAVGPRMALYAGPGRRRILPPLVFGLGVLWHLLRHGRRYDIVHTCSFPYFSLLAAAATRRRGRYRLVVDWFEVWSPSYWQEYLGRLGGEVGWRIQRLCVRVPQRAFCFSRLYARRLREEGVRGELTLLAGAYTGPVEPRSPGQAEPLVVFAGRHIPEKRVLTIPPAIAQARVQLPELQAEIVGDGPERAPLIRRVDELGLHDVVRIPGFVSTDTVDELISHALCLLLPSQREGYGLIVIEAASRGTPSIVVAGPDNAAVELISEGTNGFIAPSASPEDLAGAIFQIHDAGPALRASTAAWFAANARRLSLDRSLEIVLDAYGHGLLAPEPNR
ncbi:MAG TPA: glycosyltransferase family 4 protein [Solirubrobacteraceae bacterium]|nr:glycosyltransferase family 4 protein [Solirubrobacteraceae bacterium]